MPKAYLVARIDVQDQEKFSEFRNMSGPIIKDHGGRLLVRNSQVDLREGGQDFTTVIIVEFDDMEAARRFYESEEYQAAIEVRQQAADTTLFLVEGAPEA